MNNAFTRTGGTGSTPSTPATNVRPADAARAAGCASVPKRSLILQPVRPVIRRWSSSGYDLIGSSSSPAGGSPVRVAARRPGSRLAARSGNGPGRSPASKAPLGGATERSVAQAKPAASLDIEGEPSRAAHGEGHGSGEDPGSAAVRDSSA